MAGVRNAEELLAARRELFDSFPGGSHSAESFSYQVRLASEIRRTEAELTVARTSERKEHLHAVRQYGDALAMSYLSRYATRQLYRNPGSPAHLTAQGPAFDFTLSSARRMAESGVPVVVSDLTNIIKIGDIVICTDPDAPTLVECKSGGGGRTGGLSSRGVRQVARMQSVEEFFASGAGVIFGERSPRNTIVISASAEFNFDLVGELVREALDHRPVVRAIQQFELVSAARLGEVADGIEDAVRRLGPPRPGTEILTGTSLDLIAEAWSDIPPPMLWEVSPSARWELMEGNVSISHSVRADAFVGMRAYGAEAKSVSRADQGFPWQYEIDVNGESIMFSALSLRDVVYGHETLSSAGRRMLEAAVRGAEFMEQVDAPS